MTRALNTSTAIVLVLLASQATADVTPQEVWASWQAMSTSAGQELSVGNTVDLKSATYANTIGSPELIGTWTDPEFDPAQHALYYVRVLEIPTPRWSTYDAVRNNLPLLPDVPETIQERAWTSPIWYSPRGT